MKRMMLIGNGRVITRDPQAPFIEKGAVLVDRTLIREVGNLEEMKKKYAGAEFIDAGGKLIMPAYINTHGHIYSSFARGMAIQAYAPENFLDILEGLWWTLDKNLSLEDVYLSAMASYIDCIKNGVATVFDHHASFGAIRDSLFKIAQAAKETGIRSCLCYEVSDRAGEEKAKEGILENAAFIRYAAEQDEDMLAGMMGLHAQFTLSDQTLALAAEHKPEGVGYHIHVAEGIEDLHCCLKQHGKRTVDRLMDHGILGSRTLLAHCIYINEHEMRLIKDTDTMVVHNPESNMGNACGCPPSMEIYKKGILCGLGTDGYTNDMTESYKVANLLHKHHLCDAKAAWAEIPSMLFEGNARIAGRYFKRELGVLKEGAAADLIIVDYDPLTPMHADNLNGHILFGICGRQTLSTIVNGKFLMKDRELIGIDEEKIMAQCRAAAKNLWGRINAGKQR